MKLIRQGVKFLRAWLRWRWLGAPRRSDTEIKRIFYTYCDPCGYYHPVDGECIQCECSVSPNSDKRNKIAYKTEHCPEKGKW